MIFEFTESGDRYWYNNEEEFHNCIGPAIIYNDGDRYWYRHGVEHRLNGPSTMLIDGIQYWGWLGIECTEQQHSIFSNIRFFTRRIKI